MLIRCVFEYFQKKRKVLTINKKMEILTNLENGLKNWEICKKYNVLNLVIGNLECIIFRGMFIAFNNVFIIYP